MFSFFHRKRVAIIMKESYCELLTQYVPSISEIEDLRSTYITNCVFNNFLTYKVIILNIVTIHAIRKTSPLPKTLKTLLLSLAVSDVGVGLLVPPFYTSILVKWLQNNIPSCNTLKVFMMITELFSFASLLGVMAITVDRFLAIQLHLRYQELVTHKRVVAVVISVWLLSTFNSLISLWVPLDIHFLCLFILNFASVSFLPQCFTSGFFGRTTPQESDSVPTSTTKSRDWRNGALC